MPDSDSLYDVDYKHGEEDTLGQRNFIPVESQQNKFLDYKISESSKLTEKLVETLEKTKEFISSLSIQMAMNTEKIRLLEENYKDVCTKNTCVGPSIKTEFKDIMSEVRTELKGIREENLKLNERVAKLEKWRWVVVGGASVLLFLSLNGATLISLLGHLLKIIP